AKKDIAGQVQAAKELGLNHVELDGAVPNPYLSFTKEEKEAARSAAKKAGITLSLHLPYTYVAGSFCAPHESDRVKAVELMKRYVDFASEIGCKYVNVHPGVVPFYHAVGKYLDLIRESLLKSTMELGEYCKSHCVILLLENNTAFDGAFYEPEDLCTIIEKARSQGAEVYLNFDIGHWFTRADVGKDIPDPPEKIMEEIPDGMFKELHLNDYVPGKRLFHPPLHEGVGPLKRENLVRYAEILKRKGAELVVLETAIKTKEQVLASAEILKEETEFIRGIFG
ncbi:MAG: sugar phosphate isomerase/epimerase family protein, partial [Candidatus Hadarchaeales archaeon]